MTQTTYINDGNSYLTTIQLLTPDNSDQLYTYCLTLPHVKYPKVKTGISRRWIGFFSNETKGYYFSGQLAASTHLPNYLESVLLYINSYMGTSFNGILLNIYPDGKHYIGAHSDAEKDLCKCCPVVGISLGVDRKFRIRKINDELMNNGKKFLDIITKHGQVLVMGGDFQKTYKHEIPIESTVSGARISLTFRHHVN